MCLKGTTGKTVGDYYRRIECIRGIAKRINAKYNTIIVIEQRDLWIVSYSCKTLIGVHKMHDRIYTPQVRSCMQLVSWPMTPLIMVYPMITNTSLVSSNLPVKTSVARYYVPKWVCGVMLLVNECVRGYTNYVYELCD